MFYYILAILFFLVLFLIYAIKKYIKEPEINDYYYLWSKRVLELNTYNLKQTEECSDFNTIKEQIINSNNILWIRNTSKKPGQITDLDIVGEMLNLIKKPIILVTSDGDRPVPSSYNKKLVNKLLSSSKIKKWYTQNYDKSIIHPKLDYYPIGLDMHTKKYLNNSFFDNFKRDHHLRLNKFNYYLDIRKKYSKLKINKIFCDSHLSISHSRRKEMYQILKNNKFIDFQNKRTHYRNILDKYGKYRFILSPRGNGLDCHRTWEVFLTGSVIITESCSLDDMYIKNKLPVIIIKDYNKLNEINLNQLNLWWEQNKKYTNKDYILKKFNPVYWVKPESKIPLVLYKTGPFLKIPDIVLAPIKESCLNLNSSYEYFDDDMCYNFIKNNFEDKIFRAYDMLVPPAFKADFWRYCILYLKGGIYGDLTQSVLRPYMVNKNNIDMIITKDRPKDSIQISFLCSIPKNNFIKYVIDDISTNILEKKKGKESKDLTGPCACGRNFLKFFKIEKMKPGINKYIGIDNKTYIINMEFKEIGGYLANFNDEKYFKTKIKTHHKLLNPKNIPGYHTHWKNDIWFK